MSPDFHPAKLNTFPGHHPNTGYDQWRYIDPNNRLMYKYELGERKYCCEQHFPLSERPKEQRG